jgi:ribose-phosphate pyrophosphokinase
MNAKYPTPGILAGSTHPQFAKAVAKIISKDNPHLIEREIKMFPNGEIDIKICETVAGLDVFIIQTSLTGKANDNFMETILLADALFRARAKSVNLVQLCYPYARKDRKEDDKKTQRPKRCPISAKVVAMMLQQVGIRFVATLHLHAPQIVGFFDYPSICENIVPFRVFAEYLEREGLVGNDTVMAGPDIGAAKQVDTASESMGLLLALIHKNRDGAKVNIDRLNVIGDVKDKNVVVYDDMIDTGGTAIAGAEKFKKEGAKRIFLMATHGIFSGDAVERLANSPFEKIIITDSIPNEEIKKYPNKFVVLSVVEMIAGTIANLFNDESLDEIVKHNIHNKPLEA